MSLREKMAIAWRTPPRRFNIEPLKLPLPESTLEIVRDDSGRRIYTDRDGVKYLSVTSLLGMVKNENLEKWIKSVGKEYADKLKNEGAARGKALHSLCEDYVLGKPFSASTVGSNFDLFNQLKPILDARVGTVFGVERQLLSYDLQIAGTADLIAEFDGKLSIIDFKNARKEKKEEHIMNYFLQTTAYAMMIEELMKDVKVEQIVVLIANNDSPTPQIFIKDPNVYKADVRTLAEDLWLKTLTSDSALEIFQNISND